MLKLKDVEYEDKNSQLGRKILDGVTLDFNAETLTVITGPNGSGKSTLAEIMMGIKKPTAGEIRFCEKDVTRESTTEHAKLGMAYAFQTPVKFKGITVYDILNIARGVMMSKDEAGEALRRVGLNAEDYLMREINDKLSGGELKRIEIAGVLARDAKLMIFDEPEAGIDIWSFSNLEDILLGLKKEGRTLIVISHQARILEIADEIVILDRGAVKAKGVREEMLARLKEGYEAI